MGDTGHRTGGGDFGWMSSLHIFSVLKCFCFALFCYWDTGKSPKCKSTILNHWVGLEWNDLWWELPCTVPRTEHWISIFGIHVEQEIHKYSWTQVVTQPWKSIHHLANEFSENFSLPGKPGVCATLNLLESSKQINKHKERREQGKLEAKMETWRLCAPWRMPVTPTPMLFRIVNWSPPSTEGLTLCLEYLQMPREVCVQGTLVIFFDGPWRILFPFFHSFLQAYVTTEWIILQDWWESWWGPIYEDSTLHTGSPHSLSSEILLFSLLRGRDKASLTNRPLMTENVIGKKLYPKMCWFCLETQQIRIMRKGVWDLVSPRILFHWVLSF